MRVECPDCGQGKIFEAEPHDYFCRCGKTVRIEQVRRIRALRELEAMGPLPTIGPGNQYSVIRAVAEAWAKHPELRLGQLICAAAGAARGRPNADPFYYEDDELIDGLRTFAGLTKRKEE